MASQKIITKASRLAVGRFYRGEAIHAPLLDSVATPNSKQARPACRTRALRVMPLRARCRRRTVKHLRLSMAPAHRRHAKMSPAHRRRLISVATDRRDVLMAGASRLSVFSGMPPSHRVLEAFHHGAQARPRSPCRQMRSHQHSRLRRRCTQPAASLLPHTNCSRCTGEAPTARRSRRLQLQHYGRVCSCPGRTPRLCRMLRPV